MKVILEEGTVPEGYVRVFPISVPDFVELKLELLENGDILEIRVKNKLTREGIIREFKNLYGFDSVQEAMKVDRIVQQMVRKVDHNPR